MKWSYVPNTNNLYKIFENGEVYSVRTGKKMSVLASGFVSIRINNQSIAISVAKTLYTVFGVETKGRRISGVYSEWAKDNEKSYKRREYHRQYVSEYYKKNKVRHKEIARLSYRKSSQLLTSSYIKSLLTGDSQLHSTDVTDNLIQLKTKEVWLHRKLKQRTSLELQKQPEKWVTS